MSAPSLVFPDFSKAFDIECVASGVGVGAVLMQEEHRIACFSEKLSGVPSNYPTYDTKLYSLVRALKSGQHYLWTKDLITHTDHESQKGSTKAEPRSGTLAGLSSLKQGKANVAAAARSRRCARSYLQFRC